MKRHAKKILNIALFLSSFVVGALLFARFGIAKPSISAYKDHGLPIININLKDTTLDTIKNYPKDYKYPGNELEVKSNGVVSTYQNVEIKLRGNSSTALSKKPYQIKLASKTNLLNQGSAKKWILQSGYDATFLRNEIAYYMANVLGAEKTSRGEFVELYIDGEYEGLYYLHHKIEISKQSVNLINPSGILIEIDASHYYGKNCYKTYATKCITIKDTVSKNSVVQSAAISDFLTTFNELEMLAEEGNYEEVAKIIDAKSFVEYFIVNEFSSNPDSYHTSFFMYRDGPDDKIHAGPVWDFDLAFANTEYDIFEPNPIIYDPTVDMTRRAEAFGDGNIPGDPNVTKLFYHLMDMPEFRSEVSKTYQEKISPRRDEIESHITKTAKTIRPAALVDLKKWKVGDFDEALSLLCNWVSARFDHFETTYGSTQQP